MKTNLSKVIFCFSLLLLLTSSTSILADKYLKGTVVFNNGEKMDGYVFAKVGKSVKFKLEENSKSKKLDADDIYEVTFYTDSDFIRLKYVYAQVPTLKRGYKKTKNKLWLYVVESCEEIDILELFVGIDVSRTKVYLYQPEPSINRIFAKRKDEEQATFIAAALSSHYPGRKSPITVRKANKDYLGRYFKDDTNALKIIDSEIASVNLILEIFDSICKPGNQE